MSKKENNFEESMDKLENIVTELEKGNLNLDETLKKFKEGIKLSKECNEILQEAEKKITILIENANGDIEESDFGGVS